MNFLLDTNVISEWRRPAPDPRVVDWLAAADEDRLFISAVTIAEIRFGVECMTSGARRRQLEQWLTNDLPLRFEHRIIPIDTAIADLWGRLTARGRLAGRPISGMDAFIAATAEVHELTLVTRNISHFEAVGIRMISPWTTGSS